MDKKITKILLALDPNTPELKPARHSLDWLKSWNRTSQLQIDAIYVKHEGCGQCSNENDDEAQFKKYVQAIFGDSIGSKILRIASSGRQEAVKFLSDYVAEKKYELLVCTSHGRSGLGKFFLGSFAEGLLATSTVPLLFLNPGDSFPLQEIKKILFPTDFSEESSRALDLLLFQIGDFQGEIILYHAVPPPGAIYDTGLMVPVYIPDDYWGEYLAWVNEASRRLIGLVQKRGFKARIVTQDGILNTAEAIRMMGEKEHVNLIAMASIRKPLESAVIGSVAKGVFRESRWPVWICGPEMRSASTYDMNEQSQLKGANERV